MDIYWILVALVFLIGVPIQPHLSKFRTRIYLWLIFIMLLIVSGFRAFTVGTDTKTYVGMKLASCAMLSYCTEFQQIPEFC